MCSFPIGAIDEVFDGPYLTFNKDTREWESEENRKFNVSFQRGNWHYAVIVVKAAVTV